MGDLFIGTDIDYYKHLVDAKGAVGGSNLPPAAKETILILLEHEISWYKDKLSVYTQEGE